MKPARVLAATLVTTIALTGCAETLSPPTPPATPIFDQLIVPGQRIGPISLGMSSADLLRVLGPPHSSVGNYHIWGKRTAFVPDDEDGVYRVVTPDPKDATAEGVRVGSSRLEMNAKMGRPWRTIDRKHGDSMEYRYCYPSGIIIYYFDSSVITSIATVPPGFCR